MIFEIEGYFHRSRFNRRIRRLGNLIARLNDRISSLLNEGENIYLVDSIPVPICKIVREKRCKICKDDFETTPDKGYSAVNKSWFYGYKLHLATSVRGVYSSMELTKASIHDIHFLDEINHSGIGGCALIGDKGLSVRILCKITAVTLLQYINFQNKKPLNHLKYALAS